MASFRIHEDRENLNAVTRAKDAYPQKRNVLGPISTNNFDGGARIPGKQLLKPPKQDTENYNPNKHVTKTLLQVPVVPVAQFEAISVYEAAAENKKKTLKAHIELEKASQNIEHKSPTEDKILHKDSPMSIDRSLLANIENKPILENPRNQRDTIYDMTDYRDDIYKYMRECETKHRPKPGYMAKQPDITYSMRTVLVDWLVEVAEEYKLQGETLFFAVTYIDRFLSYMSVVRAKLQLVGTAAMFVAAKYEEIYPPDVGEFVYITDDTYTKKQVLRMEHLILKVLSFDLSVPTSLTFVKEFCTTYKFDEKVTYLSMYLIELALLEADPYLKILPSQIASAAMALARYTLDQVIWTPEFEKSTGYSLDSLRPCITHLQHTFSQAPLLEQQAIQEKYKQAKHHHVALILPKEPIPDPLFMSLYSESEVSTITETSAEV